MQSKAPLAVIDREIIRSLRQLNTIGQVDIIQQLKAIFFTQGADTLEALLEAVEAKDLVQAAAMAHKLKGSAGTIGAVKLAALCEQAECLAQDKKFNELEPLLEEVYLSFEAAREALQDI